MRWRPTDCQVVAAAIVTVLAAIGAAYISILEALSKCSTS